MTFRKLFVVLMPLLIAGSCISTEKHPGQEREFPAQGVVHEHRFPTPDSTNSYALYIPPHHGKSNLPCIIFFDPHGDGIFPLKRYQALADQYQFVLIGSNRIRNGMDPAEIDRRVEGLFTEAGKNLPVDSSRIILAGFSGGARIATLSGFYKVPAKGIIACGAGLAGASAAPVYSPDYYAIAGLADFNMNEIAELGIPLSGAGIRHAISTFRGVHEWPPAEAMEDAFRWTILNAMRDGQISPDTALMHQVSGKLLQSASRCIGNGFLLDAMEMAKKGIAFGDGLFPVTSFITLVKQLELQSGYHQQAAFRKKMMTEEEAERQLAMSAMQENSEAWWKGYLEKLNRDENRLIEEIQDSAIVVTMDTWQSLEVKMKTQRILSFLRVLLYMNATAVVTSTNEEAARKLVTVYRYADPRNPEPLYLEAVLEARGPEPAKALSKLEEAINLGFHDTKRIVSQQEFQSLKESAHYFELLQKAGHE